MNERFDELSRALAVPTSRRRVLGMMAGTMAASVLGVFKAEEAHAVFTCPGPNFTQPCGQGTGVGDPGVNCCNPNTQFCCNNTQCCNFNQTCCGFGQLNDPCCDQGFETCTATTSQPQLVAGPICCPNQAVCGNSCCVLGEPCINGQCCANPCFGNNNTQTCCGPGQACNQNTGACFNCPGGQQACGDQCCPQGFTCNNNNPNFPFCECTAPSTSCAAGLLCCAPNQLCCNDPNATLGQRCVDFRTDPNNCGACGNACGAGQQCVNGVCQGPQCQAPNFVCGANCCAPNQQCVNGVCQGPQCQAPNFICGANCCAPNQQCVNGVCQGPPGCGAGQFQCGNACCPNNQACTNGVCGPCGPGTFLCGGPGVGGVCCPNGNVCSTNGFQGVCQPCPSGVPDPSTTPPGCCPAGQVVQHGPVFTGRATPPPLANPECCSGPGAVICTETRRGESRRFCCRGGQTCIRNGTRRARCR